MGSVRALAEPAAPHGVVDRLAKIIGHGQSQAQNVVPVHDGLLEVGGVALDLGAVLAGNGDNGRSLAVGNRQQVRTAADAAARLVGAA